MHVINNVCITVVLLITSLTSSAQEFNIEQSLFEQSKNKAIIISPLTVKKLEQAQVLVDQGNIQAALNSLNRTLYQVRTDYEKAVIIQTAAFIILLKDDETAYKQAIVLFKTVEQINSLSDNEQQNILLNIALLSGQIEDYKQAVLWFRKWMDQQTFADKQIDSKKTMQLAQFYQLDEQLKLAEIYYQKAIKQARKLKEPVIESWYVQWLGVNYHLENYKKSEAILTLLISMFPDNLKYYRQLAGIYEWQDKSKQALSAWEMAFKQGLIQNKQDIQLLAQLLLRFNYPLKAAKVLEQAYAKKEYVLLEFDYELLAGAWLAAKENTDALKSYQLAFNVLNNPKYALVIARMHIEKQAFKDALNILEQVNNNQDGDYYLLLAYVFVQIEDNKNAIINYEKALDFEKSTEQAKEWLDYLYLVQANI
ncbi:MAG: hypothetical protein HRU38_19465 [Saccharospirillaceae bacterium]|nr:hypothetical protein [Pseudomonadales bacterium]NRB80816.1 hypothetical protein [Saccharospirillaceae bacterium]